MDLNNLTSVTKSSVKSQNFDLRYTKSSSRFQISDSMYAKLGMNSNGLQLHTTPNGEVVVSVQPNEDSVFYKGKEGDADKATTFAYSILEATLRDLDMISDDKHTNFTLDKVGEKDGRTYYQVLPREASQTEVEESVDTGANTNMELVDREEAEEVEDDEEYDALAEEESEEVEEDPFA